MFGVCMCCLLCVRKHMHEELKSGSSNKDSLKPRLSLRLCGVFEGSYEHVRMNTVSVHVCMLCVSTCIFLTHLTMHMAMCWYKYENRCQR